MKGTVDSLVGLQWGSEGKGKVIAYLADEYNAMVRSGGDNAGHTFYYEKIKHANRTIPCGVINPNCNLYIAPAGLVNFDVLAKEINEYKLYPNRLMIDRQTMVVLDKHIKEELTEKLNKNIGSTGKGIGAATKDKVMRKAKLFSFYAENNPELYFYCGNVAYALHQEIKKTHTILLEGTQGFGLSLNHGDYPYCTSRDVTSSALLSDCGISPKHYGKTIGVIRTYPIRVAGNSGPTGSKEISFDDIKKRSKSPNEIIEYTTVTNKVRRVFEQNYSELEKAVMINGVDEIALMFIDYINYEDYGKSDFNALSIESKNYVEKIEKILKTPVTIIGTGPYENQIIDRRTEKQRRKMIIDDLQYKLFPQNIYGSTWDSCFIEQFLDKKMTNADGTQFERKIFTF